MPKLPCCGHEISIHTHINHGSKSLLPEKGDATICWNCGSWHRYVDASGTTRRFTARDHDSLSERELGIMRRITHLIKKRGRIE